MGSGEELFPWKIQFAKPSSAALIEQFGEIRDWISNLKAHSKDAKGYGYRLVYRNANHRQLGAQSLPEQILIDNAGDYLRLIGKQKDFEKFIELKQITATRRPELLNYFQEKPLRILEHAQVWNGLLNVCDHFIADPRPGQFIRQLDIPGTDTKFIEQQRGILSELLDRVLPFDAINQAFRHLCVEEEESKRKTRMLADLTESENALYEDLVENRLGRNPRLEQERIGFGYLTRRLHSLTNTQNQESNGYSTLQ